MNLSKFDLFSLGLLLGVAIILLLIIFVNPRSKVLTSYCASKSATYENINDVDYCLKDNKLSEIKWLKEK